MAETLVERLHAGIDVSDSTGRPIGSLAAIYEPPAGEQGRRTQEQDGQGGTLEIKTGSLGERAYLYVPLGVARELSGGVLILAESAGEFERLGWYARPAELERPRL